MAMLPGGCLTPDCSMSESACVPAPASCCAAHWEHSPVRRSGPVTTRHRAQHRTLVLVGVGLLSHPVARAALCTAHTCAGHLVQQHLGFRPAPPCRGPAGGGYRTETLPCLEHCAISRASRCRMKDGLYVGCKREGTRTFPSCTLRARQEHNGKKVPASCGAHQRSHCAVPVPESSPVVVRQTRHERRLRVAGVHGGRRRC